MIRWALLLAMLVSFGLVITGLVDHMRKMYPQRFYESDLRQGEVPAEGRLISLSASFDSSGVLFNRSPLEGAAGTPDVLSDISPAEGRPLNGPDGLPRERWQEVNGQPVVWLGGMEEGAQTFEETNEVARDGVPMGTVTRRWFFSRVQGESRLFALSPPFEEFQGDNIPDLVQGNAKASETIDHWKHQQRLAGKLYELADYRRRGSLPSELRIALESMPPDDCWVIVMDSPYDWASDQRGYYAYLPIPECKAYAQIPLNDFYQEKWKGSEPLQGLWLPAGHHGFHPVDPKTNESLPGDFALLVTGSKDVNTLVHGQWWQKRSALFFVTGVGLFAGVSLVLLIGVAAGWKVRPALPDALKPFAEHLVWDSPPWWVISRAAGVFLFLVGIAGLLSSPVGTNAMERGFFGPHVFAMAFLGAPIGWILIGLSAQLWSRNVASVLRRKDRPPILYLRSFQADARWLDKRTDLFWMFLLPGRFETLERSLYKSLAGAGPLIAIGQPGELLPPMGATRLYVKHEKWQEVVAHMARISGLVLLRVGKTDSFWWEVEHVIESCPPAKVLFLLPPNDRLRAYDALARHLAPRLKQLFPPPSVNMEFVGFREDWSPVLLGNNQVSLMAKFRYLVIGSAAPMLREALLPALRNAGYSVGRLPLLLREWVLLLLIVGVPLAIFIMIVVLTSSNS